MRPVARVLSKGRLPALAALVVCALAGCGAAHPKPKGPLDATTTASFGQGPLLVQHITYTTFDGSRVPALFSIPRGSPPRGCLIWENGFGGTKEQTEQFWGGAARLGLAIFAIDLRDHGQRATSPDERLRALRNPALTRALVAGTVKDLDKAVDYLWAQPVCRHNIGYAGLSLGGMIGAVVAAQEPRIRAVALMSVPPSYLALIDVAKHGCSGAVQCPALALLRQLATDRARVRGAVRLLGPLDPAKWIGHISPRPLLLMFGIHDPLVPARWAKVTAADARQPKTIVHYDGGHIPFVGAAAATNDTDIALFFLNHLVRPTYGDSLPKVTIQTTATGSH